MPDQQEIHLRNLTGNRIDGDMDIVFRTMFSGYDELVVKSQLTGGWSDKGTSNFRP